MTWSKFDDVYDEHEKVEDAWELDRATVGLHVMATTHCSRLMTDGVVQPRWLRRKLPDPTERDRVLEAMVTAGLFDRIDIGATVDAIDSRGEVVTLGPFDDVRYVVHDYLDRHESRAEIQERRSADRERKSAAGRKGAATRWSKPPASDSDSTRNGAAIGSPMAGAEPSMAPFPSRPNPTTTSEPPPAARREEPGRSDPDVTHLAGLLAELVAANDPKAETRLKPDSDRWLRDMRLLLADRQGDAQEVERVMRWALTDNFWKANILSPGKLREQFTALVQRADVHHAAQTGGGRPPADVATLVAAYQAHEDRTA